MPDVPRQLSSAELYIGARERGEYVSVERGRQGQQGTMMIHMRIIVRICV